MTGYPVSCDIEMLRQMEARYQFALTQDPANLMLRLDLAWCLFMHAIHEAGRESLLPTLAADDEIADRTELYREIGLFDQNSYRLLKGCLKETFTVMQLSPSTPEEIAKLHELVHLAGADQAFTEAEDEAMQTLARLSRDVAVVRQQAD